MTERGDALRDEARGRWYKINEWGLANVLASKFSLENQRIAGGGGESSPAPLPQIPFGNTTTTVTNNPGGESFLAKAAQASLIALALGGGGLGLASLGGFLSSPSLPAAETQVKDQELEINVDYWIEPDGENNGGTGSSSSK